jgi:hypothetical protein
MRLPIPLGRANHALRSAGTILLIVITTLFGLEILLRAADFRVLREGASERSLTYQYDPELGWTPTPNSSGPVTTARTIHVQHNSVGFRDIEYKPDTRPAILFIGDSFVWGVDAEAHERFTDLLRTRISSHRIVNAGVSGYGTDQEYLLLQRIWPTIRPTMVVLIFCASNDRLDNTSNVRYDGYRKPYFLSSPTGVPELRGQPVPKSRQLYIKHDWLVRHLWLARVVAFAYVELRHPPLSLPDPTETLVSEIHKFLAAQGTRLLIGLQSSDGKLIDHLNRERIPFVAFDGAEAYPHLHGSHWTPNGHKLVADRMLSLLSDSGIKAANDVSR